MINYISGAGVINKPARDIMISIVLVCTGNMCRSAMAEGIMKKRFSELGRNDFVVSSMVFMVRTVPVRSVMLSRYAERTKSIYQAIVQEPWLQAN